MFGIFFDILETMDLPGIAIKDFYQNKKASRLYVHDQFGPKVEMPISVYFRDEKQMPKLEALALRLCQGSVLEIGAGAGSHALQLQERGIDVSALEISPASCETMILRGVEKVICADFFKYSGETFDQLLLLMNGIGISGDIKGLKLFLKHAESLLNPEGSIIFDSSDIAYMYEDGIFPTEYYGEVKCCYEYNNHLDSAFKWLYIDKNTLRTIVTEAGWDLEIIYEDHQDQYLAQIKKQKTTH